VATDGPDTSIAVTILSVPPDAAPTDPQTDVMAPGRTEPLVIGYGWLRASYRDSVALRGLSTPTGLGPVDNPMVSGSARPWSSARGTPTSWSRRIAAWPSGSPTAPAASWPTTPAGT